MREAFLRFLQQLFQNNAVALSQAVRQQDGIRQLHPALCAGIVPKKHLIHGNLSRLDAFTAVVFFIDLYNRFLLHWFSSSLAVLPVPWYNGHGNAETPESSAFRCFTL